MMRYIVSLVTVALLCVLHTSAHTMDADFVRKSNKDAISAHHEQQRQKYELPEEKAAEQMRRSEKKILEQQNQMDKKYFQNMSPEKQDYHSRQKRQIDKRLENKVKEELKRMEKKYKFKSDFLYSTELKSFNKKINKVDIKKYMSKTRELNKSLDSKERKDKMILKEKKQLKKNMKDKKSMKSNSKVKRSITVKPKSIKSQKYQKYLKNKGLSEASVLKHAPIHMKMGRTAAERQALKALRSRMKRAAKYGGGQSFISTKALLPKSAKIQKKKEKRHEKSGKQQKKSANRQNISAKHQKKSVNRNNKSAKRHNFAKRYMKAAKLDNKFTQQHIQKCSDHFHGENTIQKDGGELNAVDPFQPDEYNDVLINDFAPSVAYEAETDAAENDVLAETEYILAHEDVSSNTVEPPVEENNYIAPTTTSNVATFYQPEEVTVNNETFTFVTTEEFIHITEIPTTEAVIPTTKAVIPTTEAVIPTTEAVIPTTEAVIPTTEAVIPTTEAVIPTTEAIFPITTEAAIALITTETFIPTTESFIQETTKADPAATVSSTDSAFLAFTRPDLFTYPTREVIPSTSPAPPPSAPPLPWEVTGSEECGQARFGRNLRINRGQRMIKILEGKEALPGSFPWQIAILDKDRDLLCGGTLIAPRWVMTAAHCIRKKLYVRLSEHHIREKDGLEVEQKVRRIFKHPEFNSSTIDNDIALLRLPVLPAYPHPITGHPTRGVIDRACLPNTEDSLPPVGTRCLVMGWGKASTSNSFGTDVLMYTRLPIISRKACVRANRKVITENMFCAGHYKGGSDTCSGDSGGPLLCSHGSLPGQEIWTVYGVTSFGDGCGSAGKMGVYAKVDNYLQWMAGIMNNYI